MAGDDELVQLVNMMEKMQTMLDKGEKRMTLMLDPRPLLGAHPPKPVKLVRALPE